MTYKTSNSGIHLTALQTRTDLISGSGYHHDLSRDGSDDDDLRDAQRSAYRNLQNLENDGPVTEFNFSKVNKNPILVRAVTNDFEDESAFDRDVSISASYLCKPGDMRDMKVGKSFMNGISGKPSCMSDTFTATAFGIADLSATMGSKISDATPTTANTSGDFFLTSLCKLEIAKIIIGFLEPKQQMRVQTVCQLWYNLFIPEVMRPFRSDL